MKEATCHPREGTHRAWAFTAFPEAELAEQASLEAGGAAERYKARAPAVLGSTELCSA